MSLQHIAQVSQRDARVQDVLYQDDVLALHRVIHILEQANLAALPVALSAAGGAEEIECGIQADAPRQVGQENGRALEHAEEKRLLSGKVMGDLLPHLGYAGGDLL